MPGIQCHHLFVRVNSDSSPFHSTVHPRLAEVIGLADSEGTELVGEHCLLRPQMLNCLQIRSQHSMPAACSISRVEDE